MSWQEQNGPLLSGLRNLFNKIPSGQTLHANDRIPPGSTRRGLLRQTLHQFSSTSVDQMAYSWDLLQAVYNGMYDKTFGRRKFLLGMAALTAVLVGVEQVLSSNPNLLQEGQAAEKLLPVWQDLQGLSKDVSNDGLMGMLCNPNRKIELTSEEAQNMLFVCDGDSDNLKDGDRKNSLGSQQVGSWVQFGSALINAGLNKLGIKGNAQYANYAQPGAPASALTEDQKFAGNVQLGATTMEEMAQDDQGEIPPVELMKNHKGTLIATIGLNGDDMRPTADLVFEYIKKDKTFATFVENPSKETLTPHVADLLVNVLNSYKQVKNNIATNYKKALDVYAEVNAYRQAHDMGKMYLVATQPIRFDEAENAPYTPMDARRGTKGSIKFSKYGEGGKVAGRMVTLPFYELEAPLLETFEQSTGVQVSSLPFLRLSQMPGIFASDGHFNIHGQRQIAFLLAQIISISDPQSNQTVEYSDRGKPYLLVA